MTTLTHVRAADKIVYWGYFTADSQYHPTYLDTRTLSDNEYEEFLLMQFGIAHGVLSQSIAAKFFAKFQPMPPASMLERLQSQVSKIEKIQYADKRGLWKLDHGGLAWLTGGPTVTYADA